MNTPLINRSKNHRFPVVIISHAVWLYFRFCLSYREVEELLLARGIIVSYEVIRKWCRKVGRGYANQLRRRRPPATPLVVRLPLPSRGADPSRRTVSHG
jgi:transposase-like protein